MIQQYLRTDLPVHSFKRFSLIAALFFVTVLTAQAQDQANKDLKFELIDDVGEICTLPPKREDENFFFGTERDFRKSNIESTATFDIVYDDCANVDNNTIPFPQEAINAFEYAGEIWANHISSEVPIKIQACWVDDDSYGETTLGSAGPILRVSDFSGSEDDRWYTTAQASAILGADVLEGNAVKYDMVVYLNSRFNWHYGLDENPSSGEFDLVTVVLHEIGHGLGFIGGAFKNENSNTINLIPFIFNEEMVDGFGNEILDGNLYPNNSSELFDVLTGQNNGVRHNGIDGVTNNEGAGVLMYTPSTWSQGSSYSHLDTDTYGFSENALMRHQVSQMFAIHTPGPIFCGMLSDWGWPLGVECLQYVGAEAEILVDNEVLQDGLDFGVTNVGSSVDRVITIENAATAEDPLVYNFLLDSDSFVISPSNLANGNVEPGQSVNVNVRYRPQRDRIHESVIRISHNASNITSPLRVNIKGEALRADEIARLEDNYPNPFNPTTTIPYVLPETSDVRLDIYNVSGQLVQTLVNSQQSEGRYNLQFDAANLASGMYFYRLIVNDNVFVKRLLLVK